MAKKKNTIPLAKEDFNEHSSLIFDLQNEEGERVQVFLPQPNIARTDLCMPLFEALYLEFKKGKMSFENPEIIFGKWDSLLRKLKRVEGEVLLEDFKSWVNDLIAHGKFIAFDGKFKGKTGAIESFLGNSKIMRKRFEVMVGFWYALLQFIGAIGLDKENELRAFYTASSFEAYKKSFMSCIEVMEAQSLDSENLKD